MPLLKGAMVWLSLDKLARTIAQSVEDRFNSTGGSHLDVIIAGPSAIGKSALAAEVAACLYRRIGPEAVTLICLDDFMYDRAERLDRGLSGYSVLAYDWQLFNSVSDELCSGRKVAVRPYSHVSGRHGDFQIVGGGRITVYEGAVAMSIATCGCHALRIALTSGIVCMTYLRAKDELFVRGYGLARVARTILPEILEFRRSVKRKLSCADVVVVVNRQRRYQVVRPPAAAR